MSKLGLLMKLTGLVVVVLIFAGLFNPAWMEVLIPFIVVGAAVTLAIYMINSFHKKDYGRMATILALAAFVAAIIIYNMAG